MGSERLTYTNIAVNPDGTLRPWRGVAATQRPPMLKTDGQITWLIKPPLNKLGEDK
jgi:hypothetical protein